MAKPYKYKQHGTVSSYIAGCGCFKCLTAMREYSKARGSDPSRPRRRHGWGRARIGPKPGMILKPSR